MSEADPFAPAPEPEQHDVASRPETHDAAPRPETHERRALPPRNGNTPRRRFRDLVEMLDAVVWEADPKTMRLTFVSGRAEGLLGYPLEQWRADAQFLEKIIHPEDRDHALATRNAAIADGHGGTVEYRVVTADGRTVWLREALRVVGKNGSTRSVSGAMVDITELKDAEERSLRLSTILETAVSPTQAEPGRVVALDDARGQRIRPQVVDERRTRLLAQLGASVGLVTDPGRLASKLAYVLGEVLGFDFAMVASRRNEEVELLASWPYDLTRAAHPPECELARRLDRQEPTTTFSRFQLGCNDLPSELLALCIVPLRNAQGERIGAMAVGTRRTGGISDEDKQLLRTVSVEVGEALWASIQVNELATSATRDNLTGLLDADAFYSRFAEELARSIRKDERLAYMRWDLNGLDGVNKLYGRQAGDATLRTFAAILKKETRSYDVIGRVGPDEFAAVITGTNHEVAHKIGARIQERAVRTRVGDTHYLPFPARGFALYPDDAAELPELDRIAEFRLYNNKRVRKGLGKPDATAKIG